MLGVYDPLANVSEGLLNGSSRSNMDTLEANMFRTVHGASCTAK